MQYSTALTDALLALACLGGLWGVWRARGQAAHTEQAAWFCCALGFALPAAAACLGVIRYGFSPDVHSAHQLLSQASALLGLPLLASAALVRSYAWGLRQATWGRILLGLCAAFELARLANLLEPYRLLLNIACLTLIILAGYRQWPKRTPLLTSLACAGLFAVAGVAVGTQGWLGAVRKVDIFHVLLSLAYPLLAWLLLQLATSGQQPTKEENP
ncbi:DUF6962 family protein [Pseudomonas sp. 5P_3.1_Bac2]|uniref:DUF6962 family protein n=1 Tax=Pseudomonas sp. 5P_3.1_Bac2 TaxID=2971617 RepID=UPI0021C87E39|nr:hypothetical protein [Pseudomonas sp. 5P_3.1_Bac2]MCU1718088.1 hypothetical protein [Pseudomonas sp. 5P_3.1_Bac2]